MFGWAELKFKEERRELLFRRMRLPLLFLVPRCLEANHANERSQQHLKHDGTDELEDVAARSTRQLNFFEEDDASYLQRQIEDQTEPENRVEFEQLSHVVNLLALHAFV